MSARGDGNSGFIDLSLESSRKLLLLSSGGLHRNEMSDNVLKDLLAQTQDCCGCGRSATSISWIEGQPEDGSR